MLTLLEENLEKTVDDIGIGDALLTRTLTAQEIRARIDKWDCIKLKILCAARRQLLESRETCRMGENLFINRRLISVIYKELQKLNTSRKKIQLITGR
jgi:hypothetical protein